MLLMCVSTAHDNFLPVLKWAAKFQETGVKSVYMEQLYTFGKPDRDPRVHSICVVVEAEVQGDIKIQDKHEVSEVKAFNLKDLPLIGLSYDNDDHLKDYLNKATTLA